MERCNICREVEAGTKVDNDLAVCKKCYDKYSSYLFKGDFNRIEVAQADRENKKYFDTLITFIKMLKVACDRRIDVVIDDEIMDLRRRENIHSVNLFSKTRNCLTKLEHLELIENNIVMLYDEYFVTPDLAHKEINNIPERILSLARNYTNQCSYLNADNWEVMK